MKIALEPSRVFMSSDFHAYHRNICTGTTTWQTGAGSKLRDFENEVLMTEQLAKNINDKVGENDILIHLGDWSFGGKDKIKIFRDMLNCKRVIAQAGNHDGNIIKDEALQGLFYRWYGDFEVSPIVKHIIGGKTYVCSHYAMKVWENSHHGWRHLYGHSHHSLPDDPHSLSIDVGVDGYNLSPLSFVEVEEIMSKKIWKPVDHHIA